MRGPLEVSQGILVFLLAVLERRKSAVHRAEIPVADVFEVLDGVLVEAGLPEPLGLHEGLVVELGTRLLEQREVTEGERQGPRRGGPGDRGGGVLVEPHVRHPHTLIRLGAVFGACIGTDPAVAGGVGDKLRTEDALATGLDVDGLDGSDAVAVHDDAGGEVAEEEADILFSTDDLLLKFVAEAIDAARAVRRAVRDFFDDLAEVRVFATRGAAHRPDADFGTTVTPEDKAVLDEGDLE